VLDDYRACEGPALVTRGRRAGRCDGVWEWIFRAAGGGAPAAGTWTAPRWPAGVSEAVAGRAAMDAADVANATGEARRHRRRALIL
jgi:hypothetical protein